MNQEPLDNKPQNEVDIVALFDYFKNGIKSFFRGIANIFIWFFKQIVNLLYLVYKNWLLVFGLMLLFFLLGLFKPSLIGPKYKYEMIVQPQLNSTFELYDQVSNLQQNVKFELGNEKGLEGITEVSISPIKRLSDEFKLYYSTPRNTETVSNGNIFGYESDTVFYNAMEFDEFQNQISEPDYPLQLISVKSIQPIDKKSFESTLLEPFEKSEYWNKKRQDKINRLAAKEKIYQNVISRSDSLLAAYAKNPSLAGNSEIMISGGSAATNVEYDLLRQVQAYSDDLENIQLEKSQANNVINVLSDLKRVEDDSVRSYLTPWTGLLFGFLLALAILLLKYALHYFKHYKPS